MTGWRRKAATCFEPPGETHTLVVPDDVEEMITFFQVNGIMVYRRCLWATSARHRGRLHQDRHVPRPLRSDRARAGLCRPVHPRDVGGDAPARPVRRDVQVLVTGGSSGSRRGHRRRLFAAKLGAAVLATGVGADEISGRPCPPPKAPPSPSPNLMSATVPVRRACVPLPRLDVVNCAGVIRRGAELDPGRVRRCRRHQPERHYARLRRGAAAPCRERAGRSVTTASMLAFFGGGLVPGYSGSKGGIAQLTKSALPSPTRRRASAPMPCAPGWIATPLPAPPSRRSRSRRRHPRPHAR